jgi:hypothetical protein
MPTSVVVRLELRDHRERLRGVNRLARAVEVLATHAVRVEITTALVTDAGLHVLTVRYVTQGL